MLFYLPGVLTLVQRPDLVRANAAEAARRAARVFRVAVVLVAAAAIGLIAVAPLLCTVVFGSDFSGSVNQLRILALGAVGIAAIDLFPNALTAQRKPFHGMWAIAAAFFVMLGLDIVLIPPFAGIGAATATTIAYTVGGLLAAAIFVRTLPCTAGDLIPRPRELPWYWRQFRAKLSGS
jgi:O-antigen/teichoic acid export membrane protein